MRYLLCVKLWSIILAQWLARWNARRAFCVQSTVSLSYECALCGPILCPLRFNPFATGHTQVCDSRFEHVHVVPMKHSQHCYTVLYRMHIQYGNTSTPWTIHLWGHGLFQLHLMNIHNISREIMLNIQSMIVFFVYT